MALAWFICPYKRRVVEGVSLGRYCAIDDWSASIFGEGGAWSETEILGNQALVKVRASDALLNTISAEPGYLTIPRRFFNLEDSFADLQVGERNQMENAARNLGYSQAEIDAAMGDTITLWRQKTLDDYLALVSTRRLKPRYDTPTDTIVFDGPVQPVKPHTIVAAEVV